ncbi:MAG: hypothetical protein R3348_07275 [Xanthomonadales bacterium]|nr:hypothetical protein [Xanthomonadales bacterium]
MPWICVARAMDGPVGHFQRRKLATPKCGGHFFHLLGRKFGIQPMNGFAQALPQNGVTVIGPLLALTIRTDIRTMLDHITSLPEPIQGKLFELVFSNHANISSDTMAKQLSTD